mmetsp:Transcript_17189/g.31198  ORF Transcript_17189/g.31198 Transcript_17189/m.31198 type:complete len:549 (+) Transcript_17189:82-1728(+)|eukprot:CAMPEP_0205905358 /NCGR_PEP_ID=MMETSP1325-20131115/1298_1 /ASSEMBLY_ACC=CAM_ASM_000708 /TAXON_ID=236786 /ORGANISM="Florenciella sp., Strain RCC1007" /LENGTH=548 /DNA_ID=CAMNT_0053271259 /DNA_START=82 /DNA_END=1728 /DNA_ORIENTATION=+
MAACRSASRAAMLASFRATGERTATTVVATLRSRSLHSTARAVRSVGTVCAVPATIAFGTNAYASARCDEAVAVTPPIIEPPVAMTASQAAKQNTFAKLKSRRWWRRVLRAARRAGYILLISSPLVVAVPAMWFFGDRWPDLEDKVWDYLARIIEKSGPTFIKLAQWAATREDLFPVKVTAKFARLQDRNNPHSWADTEASISSNLGSDWRSKLVSVIEEPIGSGCIAQVHEAEYVVPGTGKRTKVAVKVLHPGVLDLVEADMDLLKWFVSSIELIPRIKYLSLGPLVDEFRALLTEQLDMTTEALNLKKLRDDFEGHEHVFFPEPFFATRDILIEQFIDGIPIRTFMTRDTKETHTEAETLYRLKLSKIGMDAVFSMVFMNNFVHADLHPGNLLVTKAPGEDRPQIAILDAGMAVELDRSNHSKMIDICLAFFRSEGYKAGKLMCDGQSNLSNEAVHLFCQEIEALVKESHNTTFFDKFGTYVTDICGMACSHRVKLNEQFVTMAMAIKVLEGIALNLNPELELCNEAIPVLLKAQLKSAMPGFYRR